MSFKVRCINSNSCGKIKSGDIYNVLDVIYDRTGSLTGSLNYSSETDFGRSITWYHIEEAKFHYSSERFEKLIQPVNPNVEIL